MSGRGGAGYAYQELLVALAIFSFAMVSIAPLYAFSARRGEEALDLQLATALAEERAEALRAAPDAALASGEDRVQAGAVSFARAWSVRRDDPHPTWTTISVTVRSFRGGRAGRSATLVLRRSGSA